MVEDVQVEEKDKLVIKQIIALESVNNRLQRYTNQEMIQKITEIIKRGTNNEI